MVQSPPNKIRTLIDENPCKRRNFQANNLEKGIS
jgi:hypothetical protein